MKSMSKQISVKCKVTFDQGYKGRKSLREKKKDTPKAAIAIPRLSKLMALAIHFDKLIRFGVAADMADLARLGMVSRARITQIMNLLNLAPEIQEDILFLPPTTGPRQTVTERQIRKITIQPDWELQSQMWEEFEWPGMKD